MTLLLLIAMCGVYDDWLDGPPVVVKSNYATPEECEAMDRRTIDTLKGKHGHPYWTKAYSREFDWYPDGTPTYFNHSVKWYRKHTRTH